MIPLSETLPCGYRVIPLWYNYEMNPHLSFSDKKLGMASIRKAQIECAAHRLGDNYKFENLHLDDMFMYNIIVDGISPVALSGSQSISKDTIRVFSRYYQFKDYRYSTYNQTYLEEFEYSLKYIKDKTLIWTRDSSDKYFKKVKKLRPDLFGDWEVSDHKELILYKNNWQWIFRNGNG